MKFSTTTVTLATLLAASSAVLGASIAPRDGGDSSSLTSVQGAFVSDDFVVTNKFEEIESRGEKSGKKNRGGKRGRKHKKLQGGKITWYNGDQLLRPACPGMPTPDDNSMTAAISLIAPPAKCGDRIKITKGEQSVVVTVVDYCAACTPNWIDVTKGVFRHFDSVSAGVIQDMEFTVMGK